MTDLAVEASHRCAECMAPFVPRDGRQVTCGSNECRWRRGERLRSRRPADIVRRRERCVAWATEHRGVTGHNPWLLGAPPYGTHLPGGGFVLDVRPYPAWPVEHRNVRALHGLVTALLGEGHARTVPGFALIPWPSRFGWAVYYASEAARGLANRTRAARLFDRPVEVTCGPYARLRTPVVTRRGHQRVRLDTITPVCISTDNRARWHAVPSSNSLVSTLGCTMMPRVGLAVAPETLRVHVVSHDTRVERVPLLGKFGHVPGWVGSAVLEVNAPARWLLECAARIGLGGRCALGFGRIRITEASC